LNIVSIDFDIIMAPSIELYHNFEYNPRYAHYYLNFFNADLQIYNQLTKWLFSQI
jgi:hypothetical protein